MDNQHKLIKGYRDLSQEEIDLMNEAKDLAELVGKFIDKLDGIEIFQAGISPDSEWFYDGKLQLQKGFMSIIRSITKPTTF